MPRAKRSITHYWVRRLSPGAPSRGAGTSAYNAQDMGVVSMNIRLSGRATGIEVAESVVVMAGIRFGQSR